MKQESNLGIIARLIAVELNLCVTVSYLKM